MLKKSAVAILPCADQQCLYLARPIPTPPHHQQSARIGHWKWPRVNHSRRGYATHASSHRESPDVEDIYWPKQSHPNAIPTPYQIFQLPKSQAYTKERYYALVKIYHPDRSNHDQGANHISALPGSVKMERYRLIVAAHEILSDPNKRSAYDKTGAGWNGRPERAAQQYEWASTARGETKWTGFDTNDSPFSNATWEDWERWYQRQNGGAKQDPIYVSNGGFLTVTIAFVALGAWGQSLRAEDYGEMFKRQVTAHNDNASKMLKQKKMEMQSLSNKDARVQAFLKNRDPSDYRADDMMDNEQRKFPATSQTCLSEDMRQQSTTPKLIEPPKS